MVLSEIRNISISFPLPNKGEICLYFPFKTGEIGMVKAVLLGSCFKISNDVFMLVSFAAFYPSSRLNTEEQFVRL